MVTMSLAGCVDGDDEQADVPNNELDEWNVHYAANADDLPDCDDDTLGRLYYVEADNQFQVCKVDGWEVITIQGNNGTNGQDGTSGTDGMNGIDGDDGIDGTSILITATPSSSCANGGNTFNIGPDSNQNGFLEAAEFMMSIDICNGADGLDGQDGAQGPTGPQGPMGSQGYNGTDGQDGAQGPMGPQGYNGSDGQDGINGYSALILTSNEPSGSNCANGGIKIETGIDFNHDGQLNASEIDMVQYVCGFSSNPNNMLTTIEELSPSAECNNGERIVSHGLDNGDNGGVTSNGILEAGEIDHSTKYCKQYEFVMTQFGNSSLNVDDNEMIFYNDELYFSAYSNNSVGYELWKFGSGGYSLVADINPSGSSSPRNFIIFNNELYFSAYDVNHGTELWKHNQTSTSMVYDLAQGSDSGMVQYGENNVALYDDKLFFVGRNISTPWYDGQLYYYDGINVPALLPGSGTYAGTLTTIGDELYYTGRNGTSDLYLWKYDGINQTELVLDNIYFESYYQGNPLFVFNNELYFSASDGIHDQELMKLVINHTGDASAVLIADIHPNFGSYPMNFASFNNQLYFQANDGTHGYELWTYDGNTASMVADINQGFLDGTNYSNLVVYENNLFFSGTINGTYQGTIYAYDGTNYPVDVTNGRNYVGFKCVHQDVLFFFIYANTQKQLYTISLVDDMFLHSVS